MSVSECHFCDQLARLDELPAGEVIACLPHSVALLGPWQFYDGYCLLVSRRHARELSQLEQDECRAFLDEMCRLARAIETAVPCRKLNYELLGNQVPHLHWHLFPRSAADPDHLRPVWLAIDRAERDPSERTRLQTGPRPRPETAQLIRDALHSLRISTA